MYKIVYLKTICQTWIKVTNHFFLIMILFFFGLIAPERVKGLNIVEPDMFGVVFVATRQDAAQIGGFGAGPGAAFFLQYNFLSREFISISAGYSTVTDDYMKMKNFKTVLVPSVELKFGYSIHKGKKFLPFVYTGIHVFGAMNKIKTEFEIITSDRQFRGGILLGGGIEYEFHYQWLFYISGDYRYIFTPSSSQKTKYFVIQIGLAYK